MERLSTDELQAADVLANNLERLRDVLPEVFTEDGIDFDVLRQLLGDQIADGDEKFGLNWHGKRRARQIALTPSTGTLRPYPEDSVDWDTTQNLMIEGDNLEVLKLLQKSYAGRVKLIYIDPPYNTGKDFVYKDDFRDNISNYLEVTGQTEGGANLTSNTETSGRFHTNWLNMMYPRLKLARDLLTDDGAIFISIDDGELLSVRAVCDDIFGEENRIAVVCHKSRASISNDKIVSSSHNFIIVYAKSERTVFAARRQIGLEPSLEGFDLKDDRDAYRLVPVDGPGGAAKGNPYYEFEGVTGYWRFSEERMRELFDGGLVVKVGNGLQQKYYLDDARNSRKRLTTWWDERLYTATATSQLKDLMGASVFDNPKHIGLVQKMINAWARSADDIVLDFFAGSGTTGHAGMLEAAGRGRGARWVLVQLPEALDPANSKQRDGAVYCEELGKPQNLAELAKERLRRAGVRVRGEHPDWNGDVGFRVFKLDSSNLRAWNTDPDDLADSLLAGVGHIRDDRTEADILYELLLKLGLDLCVHIETRTIADRAVHSIGAGSLIVCLDEHIGREAVEPLALGIASWHTELNPAGDTTVVFRDSAFADDVAKTNLTAILNQHQLTTVRSL